MLNSRPLRIVALGLVVGTVLAACRRPVPPGATPVPDTTSTAATTRPTDAAPAPANGGASAEDERARAAAAMRNTLLAPVYFEFDQADLSDQTRADLEQKATLLTQNAGVSMRIAGHTDSRGSDEYNLALGQRRGATVKRYLMERGVAAARLEVVSYGEERPAAAGDDDAAFAQNRRAEFEITSGATLSQSPTSP
jgi:peptidoglycan-associated lipoprotein